jgi:hypothetical protein
MAKGLCLPAQWFVQGGATLQTVNVMLDFFNIVFGSYIMPNCYLDRQNCGKFGHLSNPDLNLSYFLLWGLLKEMFPQKPSNETEMRIQLLSCAEGLRKTCFTILLQACH